MSKIWPDDGEIHRYPKDTKHKCILGPLVRIKVIGANCPCQNPCVRFSVGNEGANIFYFCEPENFHFRKSAVANKASLTHFRSTAKELSVIGKITLHGVRVKSFTSFVARHSLTWAMNRMPAGWTSFPMFPRPAPMKRKRH